MPAYLGLTQMTREFTRLHPRVGEASLLQFVSDIADKTNEPITIIFDEMPLRDFVICPSVKTCKSLAERTCRHAVPHLDDLDCRDRLSCPDCIESPST